MQVSGRKRQRFGPESFVATFGPRRPQRSGADQLIRPDTPSIADSGTVRQNFRSKINGAITESVQEMSQIQVSRSVRELAPHRGWGFTLPSVE
jgi:hypothetical protein